MKYFNYEKTAYEARIPTEALRELYNRIRQEFPDDEMIAELHIVRACMAIRDGFITLEEALIPELAEKL